MEMQFPPKSVLVNDAARMLGVSRRTVYYRIRDGRLRTVRTACGSQRVLVESIVALVREDVDEYAANFVLTREAATRWEPSSHPR